MNTTHTRTKVVRTAALAGAAATVRRSQRMLIVLALALGTILVALSAPVAHAAPGGDGQDTENPPNVPPGQTAQVEPLQVHASENPVVFSPFQTTKTITFTWTPQPDSSVLVMVRENGIDLWSKTVDKGSNGPLDLTVTYGNWYWVWVCREIHDTCPLLVITTEQAEIATPIATPMPHPQPPEINPTLIPTRPDLNSTLRRGAASAS